MKQYLSDVTYGSQDARLVIFALEMRLTKITYFEAFMYISGSDRINTVAGHLLQYSRYCTIVDNTTANI